MTTTQIPQGGPRGRQLSLSLSLSLLIANLALLQVFAPSSALADVNITNNLVVHQAECAIAVDPLNAQRLVMTGHPGAADSNGSPYLNVFLSTDGGATWDSTHIDARHDGFTEATQRGDPSVAFAPEGDTVYVAYVSRHFESRRIYCIRSVDGGQTFTSAALISSGSGLDKPFVATGPNGNGSGHNVYIAGDSGGLRVARSTNPATFTFSLSDPIPAIFPAFAVPAALGNDRVCITYRGTGASATTGEGVWVAYSDDGGATFPIQYRIAETNIVWSASVPGAMSKVSSVPSIVADRSGLEYSGRVYVAFTVATFGATGFEDTDVVIQYTDTPEDSTSWTTPRIVHKGSPHTQFLPWLALDQTTGKVCLVYYDTRNDPNNEVAETWVAASEDGGATWHDFKLSDQGSDATNNPPVFYLEYIGITAADDSLMAVWTHYPASSTSSDFYFDRAAFVQVITPDTIYVPEDEATIADAIAQSTAGDVILVSGRLEDQPILGSFEMATRVDVIPEPGTGVPVLDADGEANLVTFPIRYSGRGLVGFQLQGATSALVAADIGPSLTATEAIIDSCLFVGSDFGIRTSRDMASLSRSVHLRVSNSSFSDQDSSGIATQGWTFIASNSIFADCVRGIEASDTSSVVMTSCEISGTTQHGVLLVGAPANLVDVLISPTGGTGVTGRDLDEGAILMKRCTIDGGEIGCDFENAIAFVDSCLIQGQDLHGVRILDENPMPELHNAVSWCQILEQGSQGSEPKYGILVEGVSREVDTVTQLIESNTINGWDTGIVVEELDAGCLTPCLPPLLGCEPHCFDPGEGQILVDPALVVRVFRNMVVGARDHGIDYEDVSESALDCNNAWVPGSTGDSYLPSAVPTGNVRQAPLMCEGRDGSVGTYTLRIDSPGAPGNSPCDELIGALPVECAWDTLARSTTVVSDTDVRVLEDLVVPVGTSLTLKSDVTFRFDTEDDSESGVDQDKNELVVLGSLDVEGEDGAPVVFRSTEAAPADTARWWGIRVWTVSGGAGDATIDYASVSQSDWGIVYATNQSGAISNSTFADNDLTDIKTGGTSENLEIRENVLDVGGGIGMDIAQADSVVDNDLTGDFESSAGIQVGQSGSSNEIGVHRNDVSEFDSGNGIKLEGGATSVRRNTVSGGAVGFLVVAGSHDIGTGAELDINTVDGATTALKIQRSGPGGSACPGATTMNLSVRGNRLLNYSDGLVAVKAPNDSVAPAEAGLSISGANQGLNLFRNDDPPDLGEEYRAIVAETPVCDTLMARGNYFGDYAGSVEGKVDTAGAQAPPLSNEVPTEQVRVSPAVRIVGAYPNPTTGLIRFDLSVTGDVQDVEIHVVDVAGRLIRKMRKARSEPGEFSLEWDGTDASGNRVASGIYFVRARGADRFTSALRIVLAR